MSTAVAIDLEMHGVAFSQAFVQADWAALPDTALTFLRHGVDFSQAFIQADWAALPDKAPQFLSDPLRGGMRSQALSTSACVHCIAIRFALRHCTSRSTNG
eukprot:1253039-Rhodomonas_salina.1